MTQPPNRPQQWWPPSAPPASAPGPWQHGGGPSQPPQQPHPQQAPPWPQQTPQPPPGPADTPPGGFGGGFQPGQYGGLGAFDDIQPAKGTQQAGPPGKRKRRRVVIGAGVVVLLGGAGVAAWLLGLFSGEVLDQDSLQDGVSTVLRQSYGEGDVRDAQCPSGQSTRSGTTFECSVTVAGQPKKVTVRVLNDQPQYEVGAPR